MPSQDQERFFIVMLLKDGEHRGHSVVFDEAQVNVRPELPAHDGKQTAPIPGDASTFREVFDSFASVIGTYRNFLQFTMSIVPMFSHAIAERTIRQFAKSKGQQRADLSNDDRLVYEMNINTFRELTTHHNEIEGALQGAGLLPEVMLIGLVSAYDSFLAKLLRVVRAGSANLNRSISGVSA